MGDGHDDLRHQRARRRHPPPPVPPRLHQPARQRVPHQGRRLHRHGLPPIRPLLARVLRARRPARLARRRALRRLGRPGRATPPRSSRSSTSCSSSTTSPSGRRCSPSRTASGTRVLPAGQVQHDEQAQANGYVQRIEHDGDGKVVLVAAPVQFDGEAPVARQGADLRRRHRRRAARPRPRRRRHRRPARPRRHRLSHGTVGDEDRPHRLRRARRASSSTWPPPPTRPGSPRCGSASTSCCRSATPREHPTKAQPGEQHHTGPIVSPGHRAGRPARAARRGRRRDEPDRAGDRDLHPPAAPPAGRRPLGVHRAGAGRRPVHASVSASGGWRRSSPPSTCRSPSGSARFEEGIEVLRAAWRSGEVKHEGRHFSISGVQVTKRDDARPADARRQHRPGAAARRPGSATGGSPPARRRSRRRSGCATSCGGCGPRATGRRARSASCSAWRAPTRRSARRYEDEGFDEVLIWTDQVWPAAQPLEAKREAMFAAATALGVA